MGGMHKHRDPGTFMGTLAGEHQKQAQNGKIHHSTVPRGGNTQGGGGTEAHGDTLPILNPLAWI